MQIHVFSVSHFNSISAEMEKQGHRKFHTISNFFFLEWKAFDHRYLILVSGKNVLLVELTLQNV